MRATDREKLILSDQVIRDRIEVAEAKEEVAGLEDENRRLRDALANETRGAAARHAADAPVWNAGDAAPTPTVDDDRSACL